MRFFRSTVPNIAVSLSLAVIVVTVLDYYNPMMGFLHSSAARVLILITAIFCLAASLASYIAWRREVRMAARAPKHVRTASERDRSGE